MQKVISPHLTTQPLRDAPALRSYVGPVNLSIFEVLNCRCLFHKASVRVAQRTLELISVSVLFNLNITTSGILFNL
jgi:hypothetical protein